MKEPRDLFPEERLSDNVVEPNFIKENHNLFTQAKFSILGESDSLTPIKEKVTEADLYEENGGTTLSLTIGDKLIIAADTRHSSEYTINSRNMTKIFRINDYFLSTAGFYADSFEVYTRLMYTVKMYEGYGKPSLKAVAHYLHNILYSNRFFPLYSYACISGMENGKPMIYSFDCVGSYQSTESRCDGSGSKIIQPMLDSWIGGKNFNNHEKLTFEQAVELVKKLFDSAAERDVKTKDYLELYEIGADGIKHDLIPLRKD